MNTYDEELAHPWVTGPTSPYIRVACQTCGTGTHVARAWLENPNRSHPYVLCTRCLRQHWGLGS